MEFFRKFFLKRPTIQPTGFEAVPKIIAESVSVSQEKKVEAFSLEDVILFQGDSITDADRNRKRQLPNGARSMGNGYVKLVAASVIKQFPDKHLQVHNRGISGNKVFQLAERWEEDCLSLQPSVLSILIGVNDYWHTRSGSYDGTVDIYEHDFRALLQQTKAALPDVKLVIGEPFLVDGGSATGEGWQEEFTPYREAAKRISDEFDAFWIPYHSVFSEALKYAPGAVWCPDGVHPSMAGAQLMAQAWLKVVVGLGETGKT